ncbi:MAG: hypothetical protein GY940_44900 [bacterium]|nr:hypothetical protein [bacterium]
MKFKAFIIITVSALMVSGFLAIAAKPVKQKKMKGLAIAQINADSGKIKIREKILRKEFKDGGKISAFKIKKFADGYNLLRIGTSKDGSSRTEALPLKLKGRKLLFYELKWFVTCSMSGCSFCKPNYDKTTCKCPDGSSCVFGIDRTGMGYETVTVDNFEYPPRG